MGMASSLDDRSISLEKEAQAAPSSLLQPQAHDGVNLVVDHQAWAGPALREGTQRVAGGRPGLWNIRKRVARTGAPESYSADHKTKWSAKTSTVGPPAENPIGVTRITGVSFRMEDERDRGVIGERGAPELIRALDGGTHGQSPSVSRKKKQRMRRKIYLDAGRWCSPLSIKYLPEENRAVIQRAVRRTGHANIRTRAADHRWWTTIRSLKDGVDGPGIVVRASHFPERAVSQGYPRRTRTKGLWCLNPGGTRREGAEDEKET